MSITEYHAESATAEHRAAAVPMRLEVVVLPVADVDRAKAFYAGLGWRLDADFADGDYRVVQFTPPASAGSIVFGAGVTSDEPGSLDGVVLVVDDIVEARDELLSRGVAVSEVFHDALGGLAGGFHAGTGGRASGPDPERRSYGTYASFTDPDGNMWVLQGITDRLPGRV
jgi:catechol 2,3-dioxygenase-like lactoylglutathione lyase family enzyme